MNVVDEDFISALLSNKSICGVRDSKVRKWRDDINRAQKLYDFFRVIQDMLSEPPDSLQHQAAKAFLEKLQENGN